MYNYLSNDKSKSPAVKFSPRKVELKRRAHNEGKKEGSKESESSLSTSQLDSTDLEIVNPDRISRFYEIPCQEFKTADEIINKYGYKLGNKISEGGFAKVYKALHLRSGLEVACKIVELGKKLTELKPKAAEARDMKNELYIMSLMKNRYIMRLYAHFVVNNHIYIFMKLANSGTLFQLIKDGGSADETECKYFMAQLLVGIEYMHEQGIAHKDLKLENVLLTRDRHKMLHVLITDFGLSRIIRMKSDGNWDLIKSYCGTPTYMAPEVLQNKPYDAFVADIWSLGIMLFSMANSAFPFDVSNRNTENMMKKKWSWSKTAKIPSGMMLKVLEEMLEPNPTKRIRLATLVRNPWIWSDYVLAKTYC